MPKGYIPAEAVDMHCAEPVEGDRRIGLGVVGRRARGSCCGTRLGCLRPGRSAALVAGVGLRSEGHHRDTNGQRRDDHSQQRCPAPGAATARLHAIQLDDLNRQGLIVGRAIWCVLS